MNIWVLIIMIAGPTMDNGFVGSVRFHSKDSCMEALAKLPSDKETFGNYGRKQLFAFCVEDKGARE